MNELARAIPSDLALDRACVLLAEARSVDEVKQIRDQAQALRAYLHQQKASLGAQNDAAEIKLRAERRIGELTSEMPAAPPGLRRGSEAQSVPQKKAALEEAGIGRVLAQRCEKIAGLPEDQFEAYVEASRTEGNELTTAGALTLANGGRLAAFSSESVEWYTPAKYIEAAREVLGYIDLDPASNPKANEVVKAKRIFTSEDSGIDRAWEGRVWLNPPYGDEHGMSTWVGCMLAEYELARMKAGILLCNAVTDRNWFQPLWSFPICFTNHRIQFYTPSGQPRSPVSGNAFVYFGKDVKLFAKVFAQFGAVVQRVS